MTTVLLSPAAQQRLRAFRVEAWHYRTMTLSTCLLEARVVRSSGEVPLQIPATIIGPRMCRLAGRLDRGLCGTTMLRSKVRITIRLLRFLRQAPLIELVAKVLVATRFRPLLAMDTHVGAVTEASSVKNPGRLGGDTVWRAFDRH